MIEQWQEYDSFVANKRRAEVATGHEPSDLFICIGVAMINKQEAYWLLEKLAAENDYVVVHSSELRILVDDLKDLQARVKVARQELIDMTVDMA